MAPIRTPQIKKMYKKERNTSKATKQPVDLEMKVKKAGDVLSQGSSSRKTSLSAAKSRSKSFESMMKELKQQEKENEEKNGKNTFISRGLMGEGEITFTVEKRKKKKQTVEEDGDLEGEEAGEEFSRRRERDSGRKAQRWAGRRSGMYCDTRGS